MISVSPSGLHTVRHSAEGKGFEPSSRVENRLSRAARPTISGYLPFPATHGDSGPELRHARAVSARWTMSPSRKCQWTGRGVEPRSPGCKPGIFPLDEPPILVLREVRPGVEPDLPPYH